VTTASSYRPRLPRARPILALVRRDYLITRSYRNTFLLELLLGVINMLVYFFISETFEDANTSELQGAPSYFDFAVVGIIVTVVIGATTTQLAVRVRQEQLAGTLEALFIQPVKAAEVALGLVGLPFLFSMVRAAFYLTFASIFLGLDVSDASGIGAALMLAVTGAAMGGIGIAAGAFVLIAKRGEALTGLVLLAMGFVSGAVFPVSVLPEWIQPLGDIMPTRFAFDGLRTALFEGTAWYGDALALVGFAALLVPLAIWLFGGALSWSKRRASLAQY
jgi:ABC-2 type transport system permease protein